MSLSIRNCKNHNHCHTQSVYHLTGHVGIFTAYLLWQTLIYLLITACSITQHTPLFIIWKVRGLDRQSPLIVRGKSSTFLGFFIQHTALLKTYSTSYYILLFSSYSFIIYNLQSINNQYWNYLRLRKTVHIEHAMFSHVTCMHWITLCKSLTLCNHS